MFKVISIFIVLFIAGCSSVNSLRLYEGPALGADQEAVLTLPVNFDLLKLDDQAVSSLKQSFRNQALLIHMAPGPHTLILRYSDVWDLDDDNHNKLTSGPLIFEININAQEHLSLQHPTLIHYEQAQNFIKQPKVYLVSNKQRVLASHQKKENALVLTKTDDTPSVRFKNLRQLKYWWQQANSYEKKQFMQWQQQPSP